MSARDDLIKLITELRAGDDPDDDGFSWVDSMSWTPEPPRVRRPRRYRIGSGGTMCWLSE